MICGYVNKLYCVIIRNRLINTATVNSNAIILHLKSVFVVMSVLIHTQRPPHVLFSQLSSQPSHSPPNHNFPAPSVSATAHDLYPLILNMIAGFTKSASDLGKFWVVQLAEQQDKKQRNHQALELKACKTFCLMKDLRKLCKSLHTHRRDKTNVSDVVVRPGIFYSEKSTVKLREAVEKFFQRGGTTENISV